MDRLLDELPLRHRLTSLQAQWLAPFALALPALCPAQEIQSVAALASDNVRAAAAALETEDAVALDPYVVRPGPFVRDESRWRLKDIQQGLPSFCKECGPATHHPGLVETVVMGFLPAEAPNRQNEESREKAFRQASYGLSTPENPFGMLLDRPNLP